MNKPVVMGLACALACGEDLSSEQRLAERDEACAQLADDECTKHKGCRVYTRAKLNGECLENETRRCGAADEACDEGRTLAKNDGDEYYVYSSSCITGYDDRLVVPELDEPEAIYPNAPVCSAQNGTHPCDKTSVDACAQDARCETIYGRRYDLSRECIDVAEPKGCQLRGRACAPSIVYAESPAGVAAEFVGGCRPFGWKRMLFKVFPQTGWEACELPGQTCEQKDSAACELDRECTVIIGQPLDRERRCLGEDVRLGCMTGTDISCQSVFEPNDAADARGQPFRIVNGCAPPGYTKQDDRDDSLFWQNCPP